MIQQFSAPEKIGRARKWTKEYFFDKYVSPEPMSGCWLWLGVVNEGAGYGIACVNKRAVGAHRLAYALWNGPVPEGRLVCHKCDNRVCVNPAHLFLGTYADNMLDAARKGRTLSGDRNPARQNAKLTMALANEIRLRVAVGGQMNKLIAAEYGISPSSLCDIVKGRIWAA